MPNLKPNPNPNYSSVALPKLTNFTRPNQNFKIKTFDPKNTNDIKIIDELAKKIHKE
jgi:hypothetical protein